jgi:hypothetical protein
MRIINMFVGAVVLGLLIAACEVIVDDPFDNVTPNVTPNITDPDNNVTEPIINQTGLASIVLRAGESEEYESMEMAFNQIQFFNGSIWMNVSIEPEAHELVFLNATNNQTNQTDQNNDNEVALINVELPVGEYTQLRINITEVTVTDLEGETWEVNITTSQVQMRTDFEIEEDEEIEVVLQFFPDLSFRVVGIGPDAELTLVPVFEAQVNQTDAAQGITASRV